MAVIKVGIADDQTLFAKSLGALIDTFDNCITVVDAFNGYELLRKLSEAEELPDIILLDVNMPVLDGIDTSIKLHEQFPLIKLVALTIRDDDFTIIKMLKAGCCSYLLKEIHPTELERALDEVYSKGYYNADITNINYRRLLINREAEDKNQLTEKEKQFLILACSDLTYKQIASKMNLSERTIDGYRESLFAKFNVQSRVGMALEAIRKKIVSI